MIKLTLAAALLCFSAPFAAEASRKVSLPTMRTSTVHGGKSAAGETCVTGNMLGADSYGPASDDGVRLAYHSYNFSFKNISSVPQTVTVTSLPGTLLTSAHSNGMTGGVPDQTGQSRSLSSSQSQGTVIPAGGTADLAVTFATTTLAAGIYPYDPSIYTESMTDANGPPQICLSLNSTLNAEISVAEDRGAVLGAVVATSHRGFGRLDNWQSAPISFQLNGGRPF